MKFFLYTVFFGVFVASGASAQGNLAKQPFLVDVVVPPAQQAGSSNYLLALSNQDLKSKKYVFYTDSNATVAYININGSTLRLTGGPNPEHIMVYTSKEYTLTIKNTVGEQGNATMVIYNKMGHAVVNKVVGVGLN